jgi:hypothetical protein
MIEVKSRVQKYQVQTALEGTTPEEFILQIQTGLMIAERKWCDFLSYSGGLPMIPYRVYPDEKIQDAIKNTVAESEIKIASMVSNFHMAAELHGWPSTERIEEEIAV